MEEIQIWLKAENGRVLYTISGYIDYEAYCGVSSSGQLEIH